MATIIIITVIIIIITVIIIIIILTTTVSQAKEYCQFETFNASCPGDQVILMTMATYGRLAVGRCVSRNYGHLGCSSDVINHLDEACTGKSTCLYPVPQLRNLVQPCPTDLTVYLEAHYVCVLTLLRCSHHIVTVQKHSQHGNTRNMETFATLKHSQHGNTRNMVTLATLKHSQHGNTRNMETIATLNNSQNGNICNMETFATLKKSQHGNTRNM
ncbi:hypothetical protein HELRODRAFT_171341 [Helobdella robusta]|uniref:Uncharacterized protein n=1 Tax=Helobdella robusta TaxID=6412 RepID=T1F452_HELRO|nr:hypothetical protein HELRODRAFT_171341 [Helobdella robusta]ESO05681.1 hypothetical protein HELRODRAFT_171341 [Helobdella robusta]